MLRLLVHLLLFGAGATLFLNQAESLDLGAGQVATPHKLITAALIVVAGFHWIVSGVRLPRGPKPLWIVAFFTSLLVSSLVAYGDGLPISFLAIKWTKYLGVGALYFLLTMIIRSRRELDFFLYSLVLSAVIASLSAVTSEGAGGYWNPVRKEGIGAGANQAAGNLLMALPIVYALFVGTRSWILRIGLSTAAVASVAGAVAALSRSAFLAATAMAALWITRMRRLRDLQIVLVVGALLVVGIGLAPSGYLERLSSLSDAITGSARAGTGINERVRVYVAGLAAFASNPVAGVGTAAFTHWAPTWDPTMRGTPTVHNAVLKVAAEQGLLGLVPYLAILVLTFSEYSTAQRLARRYRRRGSPELEQLYVRALALQVSFVGLATVAMFQPGTWWRGMWVLFGLSTVTLQLVREHVAAVTDEVEDADAAPTWTSVPEYEPQPGEAT